MCPQRHLARCLLAVADDAGALLAEINLVLAANRLSAATIAEMITVAPRAQMSAAGPGPICLARSRA